MGGIDRSGELLINFFQFYARDFDWRRHAVSMRRCARDDWDVGCRTTCPTSVKKRVEQKEVGTFKLDA